MKSVKILISVILALSIIILGFIQFQNKKTSKTITENNDNAIVNSEIKDIEEVDNNTEVKNNPEINSKTEEFFGEWKIIKLLAYGAVSVYSNEDVKTMLGKKMIFTDDKASCFDDQLSSLDTLITNPKYNKTVISKTDFVAEERMIFEKLSINKDSVTKVEISDSNDNRCCFFIKDSKTLILMGGGIYLELNKI